MTVVLFVAFLALSFSHASTLYLSHKMEDPFIKWQNIENPQAGHTFNDLSAELSREDLQKRFHYRDLREDYLWRGEALFLGKDSWQSYMQYCRLYTDMDTRLMRAILDSANIINRPAYDPVLLPDAVLGFVVTEQMLRVLGYESEPPSYLYLKYPISTTGEYRSLDYISEEDDDLYARLPFPVLGVVKRLPGNIPFSTSVVLKGNYRDALNLGSYKYVDIANSLLFFVPEHVDRAGFESRLVELCHQEGMENPVVFSPYLPQLMPFAKGTLLEVEQASSLGWEKVKAVSEAITTLYPGGDIVRVFDYQVNRNSLGLSEFPDYLTVEFENLRYLPDFINYVSEYTDGEVELDITQTNVKENLNAVHLLANVLSVALILLAIACIVLFIVNLLQSYFQRVKRNLGTFKAFGISNRELMRVYRVIILAVVSCAVVIAFVAVLLLQMALPEREAGYPYLSLWSIRTAITIAVVFVASVITVHVVMSRLLKATPGDLIYDRQ
jgi:hypothetical protein